MSEKISEGKRHAVALLQVAYGYRHGRRTTSSATRPIDLTHLENTTSNPSTALPPIVTSHHAGSSSRSPARAR